jgi:hypothetical protein
MKNIFIVLILLLIVAGIYLFFQRESKVAPITERFQQQEWNVYEDAAYPFKVSYPAGWSMANRESLEDRVRVDFLAPVESGEEGHTDESNLAITFSENLNLEDVQNELEALGASRVQEEQTIGGFRGRYYSGTIPGQPRPYRVDFVTETEGNIVWFKLFTTAEKAEEDLVFFRRFVESFQHES